MRIITHSRLHSLPAPSLPLPVRVLWALTPFGAIAGLIRIAREHSEAKRQRTVIGSHWQMDVSWTRNVETVQGVEVVTYTKDGE